MSPLDPIRKVLDLFRSPAPSRACREEDVSRRQVAAVALRRRDTGVEILMITSRDTGRWIVPKGWIEDGEDGASAATREAWEEAGVRGTILSSSPAGTFRYLKTRPRRGDIVCNVDVYLLDTVTMTSDWPEKNQRTRRWLPLETALDLISEPDLRAIVREAVDLRRAS